MTDFARFPLEGQEWDDFWYGSSLAACQSPLEREFFTSQELVRNEVIQRLPSDQLALLDPRRLSDYCRVAVAHRLEADSRGDEAQVLRERVLAGPRDHPLVDHDALFRQAIAARRTQGAFASAIALQRDFLDQVTARDGPEAARTLAMDLAQLLVEGGEASRGAFIFQEWFADDAERLAAANKAMIASLQTDRVADAARELQQAMREARVEGDEQRVSLYQDLMRGAQAPGKGESRDTSPVE